MGRLIAPGRSRESNALVPAPPRLRIVAIAAPCLIMLASAISAAAQDPAPRSVIVGHLAVANPAAAARSLAHAYRELAALPSRFAGEEFLLQRMRNEYGLLETGFAAIDRPVGAIFVVADRGPLRRVEFGTVRDLAAEPPAGVVRNGAWCFSPADATLAAELATYVVSIPFDSDGERIDISCAVDLDATATSVLPAWRALGALYRQFLDDEDPRARLVDDALVASEFVPRELARVGIGLRLDAGAVQVEAIVDPVPDSRTALQLRRSRPIPAEDLEAPPEFEGSIARIGLDAAHIATWFSGGDPGSGTNRDDGSPPPAELRWIRGADSHAFALFANAADPPVLFGNVALATPEVLAPIRASLSLEGPREFSLQHGVMIAQGLACFRRGVTPCRLRAYRREGSLALECEIPLETLRALAPKL